MRAHLRGVDLIDWYGKTHTCIGDNADGNRVETGKQAQQAMGEQVRHQCSSILSASVPDSRFVSGLLQWPPLRKESN